MEVAAHIEKTQTRGIHEFRENEGYVLDAESDGSGLKLAKDGHTRLIPQPSDDPRDPLNWSWNKKHMILFIVAATAFLPDYGSATGAVTLIPQAAEWGMTPNEVNHSQAGNVFMLGAGGIFGMPIPLFRDVRGMFADHALQPSSSRRGLVVCL